MRAVLILLLFISGFFSVQAQGQVGSRSTYQQIRAASGGLNMVSDGQISQWNAKAQSLTYVGSYNPVTNVATYTSGTATVSSSSTFVNGSYLLTVTNPYTASVTNGTPTGASQVYKDGDLLIALGGAWKWARNPQMPTDGSIPGTALIDQAVTAKKAIFFQPGDNLFNRYDPDIIIGTFYYWTGSAVATGSGANVAESGFIPVTAGQSYVFRGTNSPWIVYYDATKTPFSGNTSSDGNLVKTAPAGAAYLRFYFDPANIATMMIQQGTVASSTYKDFTWVLKQPDNIVVRTDALTDNALSTINNQIATGLPDKSIPYNKVAFFQTGTNLFNKNDPDITADGVWYYWTGSAVATGSGAGNRESGFIPVTPGQAYTFKITTQYYLWYNSAKVAIGGNPSGSSNNSATLTAPAGAAYMRFYFLTSQLNTMQVELGTTASAVYSPYTLTLQTATGIYPQATPLLTDNLIKPNHTDFMTLGTNLFNPNDADTLRGKFLYWNGSSVVSQGGSSSNNESGYIPVTAGQNYKLNSPWYVWYNATKTGIGGTSSAANSSTYVTAPTGAAYVRVLFNTGTENTFQVAQGTTNPPYEKYGYFNKWTYVPAGSSTKGVYTSTGTSITNQNTYQPLVAAALSLSVVNLGISGSAMAGGTEAGNAMWVNSRINAIPLTTTDLTVESGTNDWAQNKAIGTLSDTTTATYMGAFNKWCQRVLTRVPTARIYIITTPYGELPGNVAPASANWTNAYTNAIGLTTKDYAEAARQIAKKWSLPVIDWSQDLGWNSYNIQLFTNNDGGWLHPNGIGSQRAAEVIIRKMQR